ncbi:TIGR01841 family phasin [Paraburkholderia rhizosphaerae]|uniref:Phasin family protein n=1 Tax=Paraburkholderia rhizosphaerae TaxID=480658 RepID=A0A4R8LH94_9BURK|nr:TIGR01841 family phasin [Paraburkholderia rhizosphaerae]TDY42512.1 phasin family protein [Paraburkholderia rhizosphaerae]
MANLFPEQFADAQKANVDAMYRFATETFNIFEQLLRLNLQTMKTSLDVQAARWQNALSGNGAQAFLEAPRGTQTLAERATAYNRQVFEILMNAQAALAQQAGAQYERQARKVQTGIDEAAKSGPVGSEAAVAALNSMIHATNSWYDSLYKTARQAVETAESNMNVVAEAAKRAQTGVPHASAGRK